MIRSHSMFRHSVSWALAACALATVAATVPSLAKTNFDGTWSVSIITEKGQCDRGYRYPIAINNGVLANGGDSAFDISGKVANNGAITVRVAHGDQAATGHGRLSGTMGAGQWTAGSCAGSWTAERRS
jgi:hypothetical protein